MRNALLSWLFLLPGASAVAAEHHLELSLDVVQGTGDAAMIVAWIEAADGSFVRTAMMFSKDHKYYKDMTSWMKAKDGSPEELVDAMISPTLKWGADRTVRIPTVVAGVDVLAGGYTLRVEQRKDKAGHYKKIRIPLTPEFTQQVVDDEGYLTHFRVTKVD
jgi:hypothetical protein